LESIRLLTLPNIPISLAGAPIPPADGKFQSADCSRALPRQRHPGWTALCCVWNACHSERSAMASTASHRAQSKNPYPRESGPCRKPPKIRMRSRASHPGPHRSCVPALPLSPRRRRHDRFSPIALSPFRTTSATFAKASRRFAIMRSRTRNRLRWPAALSCSEEQSQRRRPQRPGNQSRSRAFLDVPPAIRSRESPAAAGSAAIIRPSQELSRFAEPTLIHFVAPRNTKNCPHCAETVDVETSLWKNEENLRRNCGRNPEEVEGESPQSKS